MDCVQTMQQASVNKSKLNIIYTILVILYPLLSMYRFWGTMLSIADVCAIFVIFLMVIRFVDSFTFSKLFFAIASFVFFHTCIMLLVNSSIEDYDTMDLLGTTLRLLLVWFMLSMAKKHFVFDVGKKFLIGFAIVSTIYLFLQYALSFVGVYIGGGIPFLSDYAFREDVAGYVEQVVQYDLNFRARSFFEEPIHYSLHIILAIVLLLFDDEQHPKWVHIVFLSLGVICSMSLLGWIALAFVFLYWVKCSATKGHFIRVLIFGMLAIIGVAILWNTNFVQSVIADKFGGESIFEDAHFEGYYTLAMSDTDLFPAFFGNGLIASTTYAAGIPRLLNSFGIIGLILCLLIFITYIGKSQDYRTRCILWLFALLNVGSEILFGKFILLYIAFCVFDKKRKGIWSKQ